MPLLEPYHDKLTGKRMGASHLTGATLFALWKLSLHEMERARAQIERLHAHEGGTFEMPASVLR